MPRGHSLSIYARFSGKKRTSLYISREKGDHYYIQTRHNDLFSHYNLFLGKLKEKLAQKARRSTVASISDRAQIPPVGIPWYFVNPINSMWPPHRQKGLLGNITPGDAHKAIGTSGIPISRRKLWKTFFVFLFFLARLVHQHSHAVRLF